MRCSDNIQAKQTRKVEKKQTVTTPIKFKQVLTEGTEKKKTAKEARALNTSLFIVQLFSPFSTVLSHHFFTAHNVIKLALKRLKLCSRSNTNNN